MQRRASLALALVLALAATSAAAVQLLASSTSPGSAAITTLTTQDDDSFGLGGPALASTALLLAVFGILLRADLQQSPAPPARPIRGTARPRAPPVG